MAPDLLFYPVPDEREALAGVSDRKVIHPTAQYRVDELYNPIHWLRLAASEHILEFPQQCRSFLEFRRIEWSPYACSPGVRDGRRPGASSGKSARAI